MARRDELVIADCSKCKKNVGRVQRQYLGCGYEPPIERHKLTMWHPPSGKVGFQEPERDEPDPADFICAGYTTSLPEVREVALMYRHWDTGNLAVALCGAQPNEELLSLIVMLASEINAVDVWRMTPSSEGGGAK